MNCFAHLTRVNVPKHKKCLHSGVDVDDVVKDLNGIGNLNCSGHSEDSIARFKEKCKWQKEFLKVLKSECLEPRNRY